MPSSLDITLRQYKKAFEAPDSKLFETPRQLFDKGMCICSTCGSVLSRDYKFCKICHEWATIIVQKEHSVYEKKRQGKQSCRAQKKD